MDMNEHLAGVMGWHVDASSGNTRKFWVDDFGAIKAVAEGTHGLHDSWNPLKDIAQAMVLLHKLKSSRTRRAKLLIGKFYQCFIQETDASEPFWNTIGYCASPSLCEAICLAVCRATGYEE